MFKKDNENPGFNKWLEIIHNDLCNLRLDIQDKGKSKKDKELYKQLEGLRNSIVYDACSGLGYVHEGKFYKSIDEINADFPDVDELDNIERVMSVEYLIHFIDQILGR